MFNTREDQIESDQQERTLLQITKIEGLAIACGVGPFVNIVT